MTETLVEQETAEPVAEKRDIRLISFSKDRKRAEIVVIEGKGKKRYSTTKHVRQGTSGIIYHDVDGSEFII